MTNLTSLSYDSFTIEQIKIVEDAVIKVRELGIAITQEKLNTYRGKVKLFEDIIYDVITSSFYAAARDLLGDDFFLKSNFGRIVNKAKNGMSAGSFNW